MTSTHARTGWPSKKPKGALSVAAALSAFLGFFACAGSQARPSDGSSDASRDAEADTPMGCGCDIGNPTSCEALFIDAGTACTSPGLQCFREQGCACRGFVCTAEAGAEAGVWQ
jgi:hypothetical protein